MEVCILASGSKGNSMVVSAGETRVMVDAGLSAREIERRLAIAGIAPTSLTAIIFTHDHSDHFNGIEVFRRRYPTRLLANEGTASGIEHSFPRRKADFEWEIFETATAFELGDLLIEPFTISHDAADPVGFLFDDGSTRLCLATDLGQETLVVRDKLSRSHGVILESNHDYDMLMASDRSYLLKQRIAGRSGHLSNEDAAALMAGSLNPELRTVMLAHLSEDCNTVETALCTMRRTLRQAGREDIRVETLSQHSVKPFFQI